VEERSASAAASDTSAPTASELEISPTTIDLSSNQRTVTLTVRIRDASGTETPTVLLSSESTTQSAGFGSMTLISGDHTDGTWQRDITLPETAATGTWTASLYPLHDIHGNSGSFA